MDKKFLQGVLAGMAGMLLAFLLVFGIGNAALGGIGIVTRQSTNALGSNPSKVLDKMNFLRYNIDEYFMEDVTDEQIEDGIYKGMFEGLDDPYSCYYTKEEYKALQEENSGTYCGIGAIVTQDKEKGAVYILKTFEGGAAAEAGIKAGDIIYKVDGKNMTGKELSEVVQKTKGEEGSTVEIEFYLSKEKKYKTFKLTRKKVEVPTVDYKMLDGKIGYIMISSFDEVTDEQYKAAIQDLEQKGMKGMIVDLRDNGGGLLESVVNMLDYMLPEGKVLVSTKDKNGKGETYKSKTSHAVDLPIVVLVNENTASASEVFSGAVQDYKTATIVGTTTFGKGIVQSVIPLNDGTAIKLTTSKYYTPDGRNIHKKGIEPDIKVETDPEGKKDTQFNEALRIVKQKVKAEKDNK